MVAPKTYEELKQVIAGAYPGLSKQLQRVARFATEKPSEFALGTVASVAAATEVQPSAMIRFANALGYSGFSEMQAVFRGHLREQSESYRERIDSMRRKQASGSHATPLEQLVSESVAELLHLGESVKTADIERAAKILCAAPRIFVLAQRRAFPVASYLAYGLGQLELRTHLLDGAGGMLGDSLRAIGPKDVLLVTSFRSYSPEVVAAANGAAATGATVVAITDDELLSPLKTCAKACLFVGDQPATPFRSLVSPLCLAQALVVSVGHRLAERAAKP